MIGLLQRVSSAGVCVSGSWVARIGPGLAVLVGVRPEDTPASAQRLLDRLFAYRVFSDAAGRMNLSLADTRQELLLVPQFTLAADTRKGLRPGFSSGAPAPQARQLFEHLVDLALQRDNRVQSGLFGAHMQLSLVNDGPVTFWLESPA